MQGLDHVPEDVARAARAKIAIRPGATFRERDWTDAKRAVERALRDGGFPDALAGGEARVDVERRVVTVFFRAISVTAAAADGAAPDRIPVLVEGRGVVAVSDVRSIPRAGAPWAGGRGPDPPACVSPTSPSPSGARAVRRTLPS